jgi:hypothetical protein
MTYTRRTHYTPAELDSFALRDLLSDAEQSEAQAINGPFFPDRDITAESLRAYAAECRAKAARYTDGGAHAAVLAPPESA